MCRSGSRNGSGWGRSLFAAGAGVLYLAKRSGVTGPGAVVAGLAYELSPYFLQYIQRISAILLPWSGLGWMVAFAVLALRRGGWRYPALFAFVVALVGATNATSLIYVGIAPLAWLFYGVFVLHESSARAACASAGLKMGVLSLGVSLFWIVGLRIEGAYGINILMYTETLPAIAGTSLASEVIRGLGYWYFYGSDRLGPWLQAAVKLEERTWLLVTSFALPVLGAVGAVDLPLAGEGLLRPADLPRRGPRRRDAPLRRPLDRRPSPEGVYDRARPPAWRCGRLTGRRRLSCSVSRCCSASA